MNGKERDWKFFVDSLFLIFAEKQVMNGSIVPPVF